jgi:hypothetical protein
MRLASVRSDVMVSPRKESVDFTFAASAKGFKIVTEALYSDKLRAVIRELCTNAWDSHRDVQREDTPFEVHLPSRLDPYFYVRDFGTGMSHKDVMHLYTTIFESTKDQDNRFVGALGLGSKSPFACTDQFVIESWHGGEHRTYSAFIGPEGTPKCVHLSTEDCQLSETGMKIMISVRDRDIQTWHSKALAVLPVFSVLPNVLNGATSEFVESHEKFHQEMPDEGESKIVDSSGLRMFGSDDFPWYIKMGSVVYPVSLDDIEGYVLCDDDEEVERINRLKMDGFREYIGKSSYKCLLTHVPIGGVSFHPSRERLSYDDQTSELIMRIVKEFTDDLIEEYRDAISPKSSMSLMGDSFEVFRKKHGHVRNKTPKFLVDIVGPSPWDNVAEAEKLISNALKEFVDPESLSISELTRYQNLAYELAETTKPYCHSLGMSLGVMRSENKSGYYVRRADTWLRDAAVHGSKRKPLGLLVVDIVDIASVTKKAYRLSAEHFKTPTINVLGPNDSARGYVNHRKAGKIVKDIDFESFRQGIKDNIKAYEFIFGGDVIFWSEVKDKIETEHRKKVAAEAAESGFHISTRLAGGGTESLGSYWLETNQKVYYLIREGSDIIFDGSKLKLHQVDEFVDLLRDVINTRFKVHIISKASYGKLKKACTRPFRMVEYSGFIVKALEKKVSRNLELYAAMRIFDSKSFRHWIRSHTEHTSSTLESAMRFPRLKKHLDRYSALKSDISADMSRKMNIRGDSWVSYTDIQEANAMTPYRRRSNRMIPPNLDQVICMNLLKGFSKRVNVKILPESEMSYSVIQKMSQLDDIFTHVIRVMTEDYPLLRHFNSRTDEHALHEQIYIKAVDNWLKTCHNKSDEESQVQTEEGDVK